MRRTCNKDIYRIGAYCHITVETIINADKTLTEILKLKQDLMPRKLMDKSDKLNKLDWT